MKISFHLFCLLSSLVLAVEAHSISDILSSLSLDQKIGQLFMVATASFVEESQHLSETLAASRGYGSPYTIDHTYIEMLVKEYGIGGLIFLYKNSPEAQRACIQKFNSMSSLPLLIGQDCEWGPAMRHAEVIKFPRNLTLGAIQDDRLLYKFGYAVGRLCRNIGVHINFAPVVDVNNNPDNPVIHDRSFGDDPQRVAHCAGLVMRGMHDGGVLSCIKHFPGHGDTATDSHTALPVIPYTKQRLDAIELMPFKELIRQGAPAVMLGHLLVSALDPDQPATLSSKVISLLRKQFDFDGLVITDGLGMRGITKNKKAGEVECQALAAGNDIVLCPVDVPASVKLIKESITAGKISLAELDEHVARILRVKLQCGLFGNDRKANEIIENYTSLKEELYQKAVCWIGKESPFPAIDNEACVIIIGSPSSSSFEFGLREHGYRIAQSFAEAATYSTVIVSIFDINKFSTQQYGIKQETIDGIAVLKESGKRVIPILFGTPYSYKLFQTESALCAFENAPDALKAVLSVIQGKQGVYGKVPLSVNS